MCVYIHEIVAGSVCTYMCTIIKNCHMMYVYIALHAVPRSGCTLSNCHLCINCIANIAFITSGVEATCMDHALSEASRLELVIPG